jgi:hypothetical protein
MDFMKESESDSMKVLLAEFGDDLTDGRRRMKKRFLMLYCILQHILFFQHGIIMNIEIMK